MTTHTKLWHGAGWMAGCGLLTIAAAQAQSPVPAHVPASKTLASPVGTQRRVSRIEQTTFESRTLSFEANQGQSPASVRYLAHGQGYSLFLGANAADFALTRRTAATQQAQTTHVKMRMLGSRSDAAVMPAQPLPGQVNYFQGRDPKRWHTHIPTYSQVRCFGVYPGIDMLYYGNQQRLEYDFIVAPRADPQAIRIDFEGAKRTRLGADGSLNVETAGGTLRWQKPLVYQMIEGHRHVVAAHFTTANSLRKSLPTVGFAVASYDHSQPLIIDPTLIFSTYLGGRGTGNSGKDEGHGITTDSVGNIYVAGRTDSPDFPVARTGGTDAFVAKFSPTGTLLYASYIGGSGFDFANGVGVDSGGKAFVCGTTQSRDFPVTANAFQPATRSSAPNPNSTAFLSKLSADGASLLYSTYLGDTLANSTETVGNAIAVDSNSFAYLTGYTSARAFPVRSAYQTTLRGNINMYVAKFDTSAVTPNASLLYATYLGGNGVDVADGIAVDASGNACIIGDTTSTNFPHSANAPQPASGGGTDVGIAKLSAAGDTLLFGTYLGGSSSDNGRGIALDTQGLLYVTGYTSSSGFPHTAAAFQPTLRGGSNGFVTKLNPFAASPPDTLIYSTFLGGTGFENATGVAVDPSGCAWICGLTASTNFPLASPVLPVFQGVLDAFVSRLSPDGSQLLFSTYCGGSGYDNAYALALDRDRNVILTGSTSSTNYPIMNPYQSSLRGDSDIFVTKIQAQIADLEVIHTSDRTSFPSNEAVNFQTQVINHGPDDATNLVLTDTLTHASDPDAPFDTVTISLSATGDSLRDYEIDNHHFTTRPGTLPAYGSLTYLLAVTASRPYADGTITSAVGLTSAASDPNPGNNRPAPVTVNVTLPVAPHIGSLTPNNAVAGGAAFDMTVTGTNFRSGAVVNWNGTPRATTFVSATQLTARILAADIATPRTANVVVANPGGILSSAVPFFVGTPSLRARVTTISRSGGFYHLQVLIENTGTADATSVTTTLAVLNGTSPVTTPLPAPGTIAAGGSALITLDYPFSAGSAAQLVFHTLRASYTGGSLSSSQRLFLP